MFFAITMICYQTHTHTHTQTCTIHTGANRMTYIDSSQHLPVTLNNLGGVPTMYNALTHFNLLFPFYLPQNTFLEKDRKGGQYVQIG